MAVTEVDLGSWAHETGIQVGCTILRVNDEDVAPMTVQELTMKLSCRPLQLLLQKPSDSGAMAQAGTVDWASWKQAAKPEPMNTNEDYYEAVLDVAKDDVTKSLFGSTSGVLKMFPTIFLLFCLAVFVMPVYLVLYVGEDPTTQQWFPKITNFVLILPALYIVTCLFHMCSGRPSKFFVTISLLGSCMMLLIISDILLLHAYEKGPMFASATDCRSWSEKREVADEWDAARTYYATCMHQMATNKNISFAAAVTDYRIQDCPNYAKDSAFYPAWAYLQQLEVTEECGGWCTAAAPMWTKSKCRMLAAQLWH